MPCAANLTPDRNIKALFVGPKHSGKTTAACSFMTPGGDKRIRVLDGDGRIRGLLGSPWIDLNRIDYDFYPPRMVGQTTSYFQRVNESLASMLIDIENHRCPYETYVADSITAHTKNLILDAVPLTHAEGKGKKIGTMEMAGPADYGFESTGTDAFLSFLRSMPLNMIITGHVVDKYDKPIIMNERGKEYKDVYAESIVVGEKLSLRDKIAANITIYFDHIFRFDRKMVGGEERFYVEFIGDIACTSFPNLEPGKHDITGKNFYTYLMDLVGSPKAA
jgi:hypothetical protein